MGDKNKILFDFFKNVYSYTRIYQKIPSSKGKLTLVYFYTEKFDFLYSKIKGLIADVPTNYWHFVSGIHKGWEFKDYNILIRSTGNADGCLGVPPNFVNKNAFGKTLADAAERATCISLFKDIKNANDTEQVYFIEHPEEFDKWKKTFEKTRELLERHLGITFNSQTKRDVVLLGVSNKNLYESIHIGSHNPKYVEFEQKLKIIAKLCGFKNFNSWCPADILIIETKHKFQILQTFAKFIKYVSGTQNTNLNWITQYANILIWNFAKRKQLIPVSLKQIKGRGNFEEHIPSLTNNKDYPVSITGVQFICNMSPFSGSDIGEFSFTNLLWCDGETVETVIRMQMRARPNKYSYAQTEFISDGSNSGGRASTLCKDKLLMILRDYDKNDEFMHVWPEDFTKKSGHRKYFSNWNNQTILDEKVQEIIKMYKCIINFKPPIKYSIINKYTLTEETLSDAIKQAQNGDEKIASSLCQKIQGLSMQYFLIRHFSEISEIISKMVTHAKKISKDNCYFVKIS